VHESAAADPHRRLLATCGFEADQRSKGLGHQVRRHARHQLPLPHVAARCLPEGPGAAVQFAAGEREAAVCFLHAQEHQLVVRQLLRLSRPHLVHVQLVKRDRHARADRLGGDLRRQPPRGTAIDRGQHLQRVHQPPLPERAERR